MPTLKYEKPKLHIHTCGSPATGRTDPCDYVFKSDYDALEARCRELRKYAEHSHACKFRGDKCICGLDVALTALETGVGK